jgi:hypothetical protein
MVEAWGAGNWYATSLNALGPVLTIFIQLRKHRPNPTYVPFMRPAIPYVIDVCPSSFRVVHAV